MVHRIKEQGSSCALCPVRVRAGAVQRASTRRHPRHPIHRRHCGLKAVPGGTRAKESRSQGTSSSLLSRAYALFKGLCRACPADLRTKPHPWTTPPAPRQGPSEGRSGSDHAKPRRPPRNGAFRPLHRSLPADKKFVSSSALHSTRTRDLLSGTDVIIAHDTHRRRPSSLQAETELRAARHTNLGDIKPAAQATERRCPTTCAHIHRPSHAPPASSSFQIHNASVSNPGAGRWSIPIEVRLMMRCCS